MERAEDKRRHRQAVDTGRAAAPASLAALRALGPAALWRRVEVPRSAIAPKPVWLLDNRTRDGRVGYEVYVHWPDSDRPAVLVSGGWLEAPRDRSVLPDIALDLAGPPVAGTLVPLPRVGVEGLAPAVAPEPVGPGRWRVQSLPPTATSIDAFEQRFAVVPDEALVRGAAVYRPAPRFTAAKHDAYAVQWFAMAVVFSILYTRFVVVRARTDRKA